MWFTEKIFRETQIAVIYKVEDRKWLLAYRKLS